MKERILSFRAWDITSKKMVEVISIDLGQKTRVRTLEGFLCDGEFILMQFTGLLDKNGFKVFEGDLVKGTSYGKKYTLEVEYLRGGFAPFAEFDDKVCITFDSDNFEIVGNIYEKDNITI